MRSPSFWYPQSSDENGKNPAARILPAVLAPASLLYNAVGQWRRALTRPHRAKVPVICVGNLTVGGTGKTPTAIAVAQLLAALTPNPFFLTRGYGGRAAGPLVVDLEHHTSEEVGDEPLLLATHAPTVVSRNRVKGAKLAIGRGAGAIIMDDGFQNPSLAKDLSLVVVDAEWGFGNGRIIPAGPLRESVKAGLARADAVVLMHTDGDTSSWKTLKALQNFDRPVINAWYQASKPVDLKGERVLAFAGIGRPEKFFRSVSRLGLQAIETVPFPDHHVFTSGEFGALVDRADAQKASLVTTEKDSVRLTKQQRTLVHVLQVDVRFDSGTELDQLLDRTVRSREAG